MLFGGFKTIYHDNLERLWEYRLNNHEMTSTITRNDIGLLIYGSAQRRQQDQEFPLLRNSIEDSFRVERIKSCWNGKLGVYPNYSRAALTNKNIRHEVIVDDEGNPDTDADPMAAYLQAWVDTNTTSVQLLEAHGCNGLLFLLEMPKFVASKRREKITVPRTKERQDAIESLKAGSGRNFQVTGGAAINDDDIFIAQERKAYRAELAELEELKAQRETDVSREAAAFEVIALEKPTSKLTNPQLKILIDWKLGKPCSSKIKNKSERLAYWLEELKDRPVKPALPWSEEEEASLLELQAKIEADIALEDTAYGRKLAEKQLEARSIIMAMPMEERLALLSEDAPQVGGDDDTTSRTEDSTNHDNIMVMEAV